MDSILIILKKKSFICPYTGTIFYNIRFGGAILSCKIADDGYRGLKFQFQEIEGLFWCCTSATLVDVSY